MGCSIPINSGFHENFDMFEPGNALEKIWVNQSKMSKAISPIYIKDIDIGKINDHDNITKEYCKRVLMEYLLKYDEMFTKNVTGSKSAIFLAITEMTPGDSSTRQAIGELGFGHAWVQIDGKVVLNNEIIFSFSDRRRSSGTIGLRDIGGDAGNELITEMISDISHDLFSEINECFKRNNNENII